MLPLHGPPPQHAHGGRGSSRLISRAAWRRAAYPVSVDIQLLRLFLFSVLFAARRLGQSLNAHDVRVLLVTGVVGMVAALVGLSFSTDGSFFRFFFLFWLCRRKVNIEKSYEENDDGGVSLGVLGGASASLLFNPSVAVIGHWFDKRGALATGVACTAGGTGDVVFPVLPLPLADAGARLVDPRYCAAVSGGAGGGVCDAAETAATRHQDLRQQRRRGWWGGGQIDVQEVSMR
ncbi:hypothetical protein HC256_005590 [Beauveria bassiana]|nr:hypothetical protein HC256_005590 [Beauveria bassiana]